MARRHARSTDPLYDISAISIHDRGQKTLTHATSYESNRLMLKPAKGRTAAECSATTGPGPAHPDQIMRQVEYRIEVADQPSSEK